MCQTIQLLTAQAEEAKAKGDMAGYKANMDAITAFRNSLVASKKQNSAKTLVPGKKKNGKR